MKQIITRLLLFLLFPILFFPPVLATSNFYQQDSLQLQLEVSGSFELIADNSHSKVKSVSANLFLYPSKDYRQEVLNWKSTGKVENNTVNFFWNDQIIEQKEFSYSSLVKTSNNQREVRYKSNFPLTTTDVEGLEEYIQPTETIDSDNPKIIAKASELAEGEDDLFKVVFNLASWVEENTKYDLNTLTAQASQKASWVLENKQGVCDEMTSLFIAMARSLGIPARFVSGISYTTSPQFSDNWQPHGWAEVYFPEIGWVSFDITFNQYGYIDVTHIKLRDGLDPIEPAIKYSWMANEVNLQKGDLNLKVNINHKGIFVPEEIILEQELLATEVGFGSYNLIKGIVKNTAEYYTATALNLVVPKDIEVIGRNRRNILLHPKEVRETFWIIKIPSSLDPDYVYTFPVLIHSEKNVSAFDSFQVRKGKDSLSQEEIEKLIIKDEEKSYSRKISFECNYPKEIFLGENSVVECTIKNNGNTNLHNINFCLENVCEIVDLPINQKKSTTITITGNKVGWNKLVVSAENGLIEKRKLMQYAVLDAGKVAVTVDYPKTVEYGQLFLIKLSLKKESFSQPKNITVTLSGAGFENEWELDQLNNEHQFIIEVAGTKLSKTNKFIISTSWNDQQSQPHIEKQEIIIKAVAGSFQEKIKMGINWLLELIG